MQEFRHPVATTSCAPQHTISGGAVVRFSSLQFSSDSDEPPLTAPGIQTIFVTSFVPTNLLDLTNLQIIKLKIWQSKGVVIYCEKLSFSLNTECIDVKLIFLSLSIRGSA